MPSVAGQGSSPVPTTPQPPDPSHVQSLSELRDNKHAKHGDGLSNHIPSVDPSSPTDRRKKLSL